MHNVTHVEDAALFLDLTTSPSLLLLTGINHDTAVVGYKSPYTYTKVRSRDSDGEERKGGEDSLPVSAALLACSPYAVRDTYSTGKLLSIRIEARGGTLVAHRRPSKGDKSLRQLLRFFRSGVIDSSVVEAKREENCESFIEDCFSCASEII